MDHLSSWNPTTFYLLATVVHTVVIYGGYALLGGDPQHNTWVTAMVAAAIGNGTAYACRGFEPLIGVLSTSFTYFVVLVAFSGVDMGRSIAVLVVLILTYSGVTQVVLPRTDELQARAIGGIPQAAHQGGLQKAPIDKEADESTGPGMAPDT